MTTKYIILSMLSDRAQTGLELKKNIVNSFLYSRSDNNNQIYPELIKLTNQGMVDRNGNSNKKVYKITENGQLELEKWMKSTPEVSPVKNSFLFRLASSHSLNSNDITAMLEEYKNQLKLHLLMHQETIRREAKASEGSKNYIHYKDEIMRRITDIYENELQWVGHLQSGFHTEEDREL